MRIIIFVKVINFNNEGRHAVVSHVIDPIRVTVELQHHDVLSCDRCLTP
jgi:hypothetical protein